MFPRSPRRLISVIRIHFFVSWFWSKWTSVTTKVWSSQSPLPTTRPSRQSSPCSQLSGVALSLYSPVFEGVTLSWLPASGVVPFLGCQLCLCPGCLADHLALSPDCFLASPALCPGCLLLCSSSLDCLLFYPSFYHENLLAWPTLGRGWLPGLDLYWLVLYPVCLPFCFAQDLCKTSCCLDCLLTYCVSVIWPVALYLGCFLNGADQYPKV